VMVDLVRRTWHSGIKTHDEVVANLVRRRC
jgi:hypothetical protein